MLQLLRQRGSPACGRSRCGQQPLQRSHQRGGHLQIDPREGDAGLRRVDGLHPLDHRQHLVGHPGPDVHPPDQLFRVALPADRVVVYPLCLGQIGLQREDAESAAVCQVADDAVLHGKHLAGAVRVLTQPDDPASGRRLSEGVEVVRVRSRRVPGRERMDIAQQRLPVGGRQFVDERNLPFGDSFAVDADLQIVEPDAPHTRGKAGDHDAGRGAVDLQPGRAARPVGGAPDTARRVDPRQEIHRGTVGHEGENAESGTQVHAVAGFDPAADLDLPTCGLPGGEEGLESAPAARQGRSSAPSGPETRRAVVHGLPVERILVSGERRVAQRPLRRHAVA